MSVLDKLRALLAEAEVDDSAEDAGVTTPTRSSSGNLGNIGSGQIDKRAGFPAVLRRYAGICALCFSLRHPLYGASK